MYVLTEGDSLSMHAGALWLLIAYSNLILECNFNNIQAFDAKWVDHIMFNFYFKNMRELM